MDNFMLSLMMSVLLLPSFLRLAAFDRTALVEESRLERSFSVSEEGEAAWLRIAARKDFIALDISELELFKDVT